MDQCSTAVRERRRDPRLPQAFAFWIRRPVAEGRTSAWMLDMSAGGAAFLVGAEDAPLPGERVELTEMLAYDQDVREAPPAFPQFARVVRVDPTAGITRKVAIQFEAGTDLPLDERVRRRAETLRHKVRLAPRAPAPPFAAAAPPGGPATMRAL